jgi:hypothetical protein
VVAPAAPVVPVAAAARVPARVPGVPADQALAVRRALAVRQAPAVQAPAVRQAVVLQVEQPVQAEAQDPQPAVEVLPTQTI